MAIKSIGLTNIPINAECAYNDIDNTKTINFYWNHDKSAYGSAYQYFGKNVTAAEGKPVDVDASATMERTFMIIPFTVADSGDGAAEIVIVCDVNGKEYRFHKPIRDIMNRFDPGKKYIFTLGLADYEVDIDVDDVVQGTVKKDVSIQNTGFGAGYIRAAIVGSWVDNSGGSTQGNVVAPWDEDGDGTFTYDVDWNTHWRKGDDGLYYHIQPVERHEFTYPLFNTYELNAGAIAAHEGQKLELSIVGQIVIEDELGEAWTIPAP